MFNLGLIGKNLKYSFSKKYFKLKFKKENLNNFIYELYELESLNDLSSILKNKKIIGLNVTSPFKESIIRYLDQIDDISKHTKSVNTIFINKKNRKLFGFNTDVHGFEKSLDLFIPRSKIKGMILGNGGVSKSIKYVLKKKNIEFVTVSRNANENDIISYNNCEKYLQTHKLIINTTILGAGKLSDKAPKINYKLLNKENYMFDLTYNPRETLFLKKSKKMGAKTINGELMLKLQAELSFNIWLKELKKNNEV